MVTRWRAVRWMLLCAAIVGMVVIAAWPVTTRFGVDYQWSSKQVPLYEKAINFVSRDLQTRRLADEVTGEAGDQEDKLLRIFSWVVGHVQPTPPGFPVVDDHVLHIIIRGYGAPDQRTEAFALLASYTGFPATRAILKAPGTDKALDVALVRLGARTIVFDVNNDMIFRNERGELADLDELIHHPQLVAQASGRRKVGGLSYARYFLGLQDLPVTFSRMEGQKPWPRLLQEVGQLFGVHAN